MLIQRWRKGDEPAFDELYRRYFKELLVLTTAKVHSFGIAEEIVQDAFVALYRTKGNITGVAIAYLKAIIKNKVYDHYSEQRRGKVVELFPDDLAAQAISGHNPLEMMRLNETKLAIDRYIGQLPSQCRNVFLLSREQDLSNKEIAQRLNISVKAVEAQITKALKFLRAHIEYSFYWFLIISSLVYMLMVNAHR